jgi:hypothetical protein
MASSSSLQMLAVLVLLALVGSSTAAVYRWAGATLDTNDADK